MESREIVGLLVAFASGSGFVELIKWFRGRRQESGAVYISELADSREWRKELQAEIRELRKYVRELEADRLRLQLRTTQDHENKPKGD